MRIKAQDVAVFECARFAFVGVAHQVLLPRQRARHEAPFQAGGETRTATAAQAGRLDLGNDLFRFHAGGQYFAQGFVARSEEHTSELQSLMRISYAVFCLKKKKDITTLYIHIAT